MLQPSTKHPQSIKFSALTQNRCAQVPIRLLPFKRTTLVALFWVIVLLLPSCVKGTEFAQVYAIVTNGTLQPGTAIPQPEQDIVLTVSGKVGTTNADDTIVMDRHTIEEVGLVEYNVQDPFEDRNVVYRGVLMRDLLKLWQVPDDAKTVRLTALNDYQIDIPLEDFYKYPILYALQADGVYMEADYQGPAMLVYPLDDYEFDLIAIKRRWIWQITKIELE